MFRITFCLVFLFAVLLFSACSKTIKIFPSDDFTKEARSKYDATLAELERNRRLWQSSKIADYDFEISYQTMVGCTCAPVAVKVREGKMISTEKIPKDFPGEFFPGKDTRTIQVETIDKVFSYIKDMLDDDLIIETTYNQKFGYPEKIIVRHSFGIDDKAFFDLTNFEITK